MLTPFPPKTPMQMRLEAERRTKPKPREALGKPDSSRRPLLQFGTRREGWS